MTLAVSSRRVEVDPGVARVQERRRSNAAGLHGVRARGGRSDVRRLAIRESFASTVSGEDDGE